MGYRERGHATWQGKYVHGRPSVSGERHDMFRLSAAHKRLPFGTLLRVTDLNTGQAVQVKVIDRGPFVDKQILALSYGAAKKLGIVKRGFADVELKVIGRAPIILPEFKTETIRHGGYFVQIASFQDRENALRLKDAVTQLGKKAFVETYEATDVRVYRVRLGPFASEEEATGLVLSLRTQLPKAFGLSPIVVEND